MNFVLILDTCADTASMALVRMDGTVCLQESVPGRSASVRLGAAVRGLLAQAGIGVPALVGVGVVHGPGSFTGLRVGLAFAKGLCEAAELPLAAVSRLEVLAAAGAPATIAATSAGRDQVYVRFGGAHGISERLMSETVLIALRAGEAIAVDSVELGARLDSGGPIRCVELSAADAAGAILSRLAQGGCDLAELDAHYLREESTIYRGAGPAKGTAVGPALAESDLRQG